MGKHLDKVVPALEARQAAAPNDHGFRKPGSLRRHKGGYKATGK